MFINRRKIQTEQPFKYLVSIVEKNDRLDVEIDKRISETRKITGNLNTVLWCRNLIVEKKYLK